MWGKNPESPKRTSGAFQASSGETTYIASDAEFNGKLTLKGSARIDGKVEGQIIISGDLIVGPSAVINANIKANSVSLSGAIRGDVVTQETLELCSTARMKGNIFSKQLKIDQGAQFIGTSCLLEDAQKQTLKEVKVPEEAPSTSERESESDIDVDNVLSPLAPLDDDAAESSADDSSPSSQQKNVAYGKSSRSRRR
ncbi:Integral membrane protein CcmA involved in cell shape determination [Desulfitobacterium dichloroeliminans LMG P-21439]|uniref:Integral membrane protein CcmA involved in cell shape determination n=1 Tax=Desulfitobacterium dichloroeliminans (strain LMG P-21439 / DCA1) TaxID=871963 RepID=L0FC30_DESDL|nr:polymer-forming cytoskeletal protein [Desulfitobacterium dichloroeliminans]AGA70550.1 Integral membrane protein CcmA involved in cell shape determination [Desulfitobacterium dichloroeliminans LMG P-21439]